MRQKQMRILILVGVSLLVLAVGIFLAIRSAASPLLSLSYLENNVKPNMEKQFATELDEKAASLQQSFVEAINTTSGAYQSVSVTKNQKMTMAADCEVVIVSGSASVAENNSISDITDGKTIGSGNSLTENHLYISLYDGTVVVADSDMQIMVRGTMTVSD